MDDLSASRRDAVMRLCQAQAEGWISVETFEERYMLIREATTRGSLDGLVADLTADGMTPLPLASVAPVAVRADATSAYLPVEEHSVRIPAIVGSTVRAGQWIVPEHLEVLVVMGELRLDFREALFVSDTVVMDLSVKMGTCELIVPPGTQVTNECREILSSSKHPRRRGPPVEPNGISIIIQGRIIMAELTIRELYVDERTGLAARLGLTRGR
jgi:hypothetical protein